MAAAQTSEIRNWLEHGRKLGATHVLVVCDTFDWEDYPVFVKPEENVHDKFAQYHGVNMQKVQEVYNLSIDVEDQLHSLRALNF